MQRSEKMKKRTIYLQLSLDTDIPELVLEVRIPQMAKDKKKECLTQKILTQDIQPRHAHSARHYKRPLSQNQRIDERLLTHNPMIRKQNTEKEFERAYQGNDASNNYSSYSRGGKENLLYGIYSAKPTLSTHDNQRLPDIPLAKEYPMKRKVLESANCYQCLSGGCSRYSYPNNNNNTKKNKRK